jgi:hypothetical protein
VLFDLTRPQAEAHLLRVQAFLRDELHLELSRHTIAPVSRGVNFVGYRTWRSTRFVRKHSRLHGTPTSGLGERVQAVLAHKRQA